MGEGMNRDPSVVLEGKAQILRNSRKNRTWHWLKEEGRSNPKVGRKVFWSTFRFPHDIQFELVMGI